MKKSLILACLFIIGIGWATAQTRVSGTVVDENGDFIIGASVQVKGTNIGSATDINGSFSILVPEESRIFVISYIGMITKEVAIKPDIRIILESDTKLLDELVVVGYGTITKSELTGSISSVSKKALENVPVASVGQALQGKVSGLQITNTSGRSGGNETSISLRGNGSLRASNSILYVIDGIPTSSMSGISNSDIESISILKDAASTAIYGSRASNGVAIIKTKSGSYNQKTTVTVNSRVGWQNLVKTPELLNADEYTKVMNTAIQNYKSDHDNGIVNPVANPNTTFAAFVPQTTGIGTNWLDEVLNKNSLIQNYDIGISSGEKNTRLYLGASLLNQEGIIKKDSYQKSTLKLNVDHKLFPRLMVGANTSFSHTNTIPLSDDNNIYQPWSGSLQARPDVKAYGEDGKPTRKLTSTNPLFAFQRYLDVNYIRLGANTFANFNILDNLVFRSTAGGFIFSNRSNRFDAPGTKLGENSDGTPTGYGEYITNYNLNYIFENTVTYNHIVFDKLKYNFLLGHAFQKSSGEYSSISGEDFASNDLRWIRSAGKKNDGTSGYTESALESYFSRLQLNWDNKYNAMLSVRRDGSSKFLPKNRWGNFFAFSGAWTISNEKFFKLDFVDLLRVRASYGQTGNQDGIDNYSGQNLLGSGRDYNYYGAPGLFPGSLFNQHLTWEKGRSTNLGFDFSFLEDRLKLNIDFYDKKTKDLLYNTPVVGESGYERMLANRGTISNKGFELELGIDIIRTKDILWSISTNFSYNKNKVVDLGDPTKDYYTQGFVSIVKEGESLGSFRFLKALGVANEVVELKDKDGVVQTRIQPGNMIYEDLNGDGIINSSDDQIFGGGIAPIYGGISTSFSYKSLSLDINAHYSIGQKTYNMGHQGGTGSLNGGAVGAPAFSNNMSKEILNAWENPNSKTDIPRLNSSPQVVNWNTQHSSRFLYDSDFLRVSDITLAYSIENIFNNKVVKNIRLYAQFKNLLTFSKYKGLDPESSYIQRNDDGAVYDANKVTAGIDFRGIPNTKAIIIGLNLTF